ncbi:hypothetical protein DICPUDRAFT_149927 [Dictyostelium purpureum]|uniref:Uncharacterized protein n=1 Tax=Dictyostelium purpureum TaxID=5786 RepID=F0ZF08_DICPU|nr:uncharacterized protein DICPUDRAFT_149927 [Dictyostelium purpureum]EGC37437.1 hypothetical protein DICPUDRAFT_149927 [Dictyostelium purpureum]|eukprot:XP_003286001.1 hypothetical protein DICPUDRAFT_149927 [Dictyostelium purpureum]
MLFKSIQSINNIKSSTNNKVATDMINQGQSSNNVAVLGLVIDLNPLLNLKVSL